MKRLLLLLFFCVTSVYAKEFSNGLNNTIWKQTNLKNEENYYIAEFSGHFKTTKSYKNDILEDLYIFEMTNCQIYKNSSIYAWYKEKTSPSVYEIRHDLTEFGEVVLIEYIFNSKDKDSWRAVYIPL